MSHYSDQIAELQKMRAVQKKDISAIMTDKETMQMDEFRGEIADIGNIRYTHIRKERYSVTITTRDRRQ